jgi:hypothetical protein
MDGACPKSVKPDVLLDSGGATDAIRDMRRIVHDVQSRCHRKGDEDDSLALKLDAFIKLLNITLRKNGELWHVIRSRQLEVPDAADKGGD